MPSPCLYPPWLCDTAAGGRAALCAESLPFSSKAVIVTATGLGEAARSGGKACRFETFKRKVGG
jgi:hypothetical protein